MADAADHVGRPFAEWLLGDSWNITTEAQAVAARLAIDYLIASGQATRENVRRLQVLVDCWTRPDSFGEERPGRDGGRG